MYHFFVIGPIHRKWKDLSRNLITIYYICLTSLAVFTIWLEIESTYFDLITIQPQQLTKVNLLFHSK